MKQSTLAVLESLYARYPALGVCRGGITAAADAMIRCYRDGHKLLVCGNGGSAADALHIVGELMKAFALPRRLPDDMAARLRASCPHAEYLIENLQGALPAVSLVSETALETAYSNDVAPDLNFAQQVYGYGVAGEVLFSISTSGNSANVLYAAEVARAKGMPVIALTGAGGGKLKAAADIWIGVPETETYRIQEYHLPVYHALCLALEQEFFGE